MKDDELKAIFLAEAQSNYEELNRLFIILEKDHRSQKAVDSIFRITHTLKANAAAMGFDGLSSLSHVLEDIFSLIKAKSIQLDASLFESLFRANDKLGELIDSIKTDTKVSYRGLLTKLKVILREAKSEYETTNHEEKSLDAELTEESNTPVSEEKSTAISLSDYVQVPVNKLDQLMNLVGELAIERDRLITKSLLNHSGRSSNEYTSLHRISSDLQYAVMSVRLVKVNVLFNKFFRIVRDIAHIEEKDIDLELEGGDIEIDRNVLQTISDSMIHLVRNAVSHGIETQDVRKQNGKEKEGKITLKARNDKDSIAIEVQDNGGGIDVAIIKQKAIEKKILPTEVINQMNNAEILELIFEAGFSSKDNVTEVSGRGVGMDVVKQAVDSIGGNITVDTKIGIGTVFTMYLPASMAVKKALLFEIEQSTFAIPLTFIEAVVQIDKQDVYHVGRGLTGTYAGDTISIIFLKDLFRNSSQKVNFQASFNELPKASRLHVILIKIDGKIVGFVVDRLLQQKEIIEKPLAGAVKNSTYISGATILGDGSVCLVLDVPNIIKQVFRGTSALV